MTATLILIRHGRSLWNDQNRFTGWVDVPLMERGWLEAEAAGRLLADYRFDAAYTSHLQRAICTLQVVLRANRGGRTPIFIPAEGTVPREAYRPNADEFPAFLHVVPLAERHYGDLQGLNKDEVLAQYGEAQRSVGWAKRSVPTRFFESGLRQFLKTSPCPPMPARSADLRIEPRHGVRVGTLRFAHPT